MAPSPVQLQRSDWRTTDKNVSLCCAELGLDRSDGVTACEYHLQLRQPVHEGARRELRVPLQLGGGVVQRLGARLATAEALQVLREAPEVPAEVGRVLLDRRGRGGGLCRLSGCSCRGPT